MTKVRRKNIVCPNCEEELAEKANYCPNCGQENHESRVTVKMLLTDVFMEFWSVDNKGLRSLSSLLFRPGFLSKKFIEGKRRIYNRPLRIYLFISFIFFLLSSVSPSNVPGDAGQAAATTDSALVNDSSGVQGKINFTLDEQALGKDSSSAFGMVLKEKMDIINTPEGGKLFMKEMEQTIPIFAFLLIPLLALYMYWMFWRKDRYYVDSFVYALHCQTFAFLLLILYTIIEFFMDIPFGIPAVLLICAIYFIISAKRLYGVSYIGAILRLSAVAMVHLLMSSLLVLAYLLLMIFMYV